MPHVSDEEIAKLVFFQRHQTHRQEKIVEKALNYHGAMQPPWIIVTHE